MANSNARELVLTQLRLECIGLDAAGLLERVVGPEPDAIARFYVFVAADGELRLFRSDVPLAIQTLLRSVPTETVFDDPATVHRILARHAPSAPAFVGTSYVFPRPLAEDAYPEVRRLGESDRALVQAFDPGLRPRADRPVHAVVVESRIVSACVSSRQNDEAGEAWVQTAPAFRQRGYACQTVAVWAHDLQRQGKIPFYSHHRDNLASQAVARRLGLLRIADFANFS